MNGFVEQRTPEWFAQRCGKVTASRVADVCGKTKTGYSSTRASYMAELLAERLTGTPTQKFQSPAMMWGTEYEDEARSEYEMRSGNLVEAIGFVPHPSLQWAGASPDGLVGKEGLIEIKCPNTGTHIATLEENEIPAKYVFQIFWQMECIGADRKWCDFISYDPRLPENLRLFVKRIDRDDDRITEIRNEVIKFLDEIETKITKLNNLFK
jgi:putative phage-type endonuclease